MSLPIEDRYLVSKAELIDQLARILGGRCAEEILRQHHHRRVGRHPQGHQTSPARWSPSGG